MSVNNATLAELSSTPEQTSLSLTEAQKGIWLGQQLHQGSAMYNTAEAIELRGNLNTELFEKAISTMLQEAEVLSLSVLEESGQDLRMRSAKLEIKLQVLDLSDMQHPYRYAQEWMEENVNHALDIEKGPLARQFLLRLSNHHFIWYQCLHHLICDGYSYTLLTQRVAELYNQYVKSANLSDADSLSAANNSEINNSTFTLYHKLVEEDQSYQTSEKRQKDRHYWLNQMEGMSQPPSFSSSLAEMTSGKVLQVEHVFSARELDCLKEYFAKQNITWADGVLAAVAATLYQRTAANDLVLGIPVMGRMGSVTANIPGMVMNIIPLRLAIEHDETLDTLSLQVAKKMLAAKRHQKFRYEHLRRELNLVGGDKRLYGPVVNILPFKRDLTFSACDFKIHRISAGPVEDISFTFSLNESGNLVFELEANPRRYSSQCLQEIANDVQGQLKKIIASASSSDLRANAKNKTRLSSSIQLQHLAYVEGAELDASTPYLLQLLQHISGQPQAPALKVNNQNWNYDAFGRQLVSYMQQLQKEGVTQGKSVLCCLPRGEHSIFISMALLFLNAHYSFIDPDGPESRNSRISNDLDADFEIYNAVSIAGVKTSTASNKGVEPAKRKAKILNLTEFDKQNSTLSSEEVISYLKKSASNIESEALAYVMYTSGSTGKPKGVMIHQSALHEFVCSARQYYQLTEKDIVLQFAPLQFDASIEEILVSLCSGACLKVRSDEMISSIAEFLLRCEQWQITVLDLPTAYWHELIFYCATLGKQLPKTVSKVIIGGEAVLPERLAQWQKINVHGATLYNTYGPTEATVVATSKAFAFTDKVSLEENSIGVPLPGRTCMVVDSHNRLCERQVAGELIIAGAAIGKGYWNNQQETQGCFSLSQTSWQDTPSASYRTGDKVRINQKGEIEYLGRIDDEIKISGHRIQPIEIENTLLEIPLIDQAAVVCETVGVHKQLFAFVSLQNSGADGPYNEEQSEFEVARAARHLLKQKLPAPMVPSSIFVLAKLPVNSSGKIDRKYLQQVSLPKLNGRTSVSIKEEKGSRIEQVILNVWQEILGVQDINLDDDFFMLGGSSLQSIQVVNKLAAELKVNVAVNTLFQSPTIKSLALAVQQGIYEKSLGEKHSSSHANASFVKQRNIQDEIEEDCRLSESIQFSVDRELPRVPEVVLLTGASGFVGTHLLHQLLLKKPRQVVCLVRCDNESHGLDRIKSSMAAQHLLFEEEWLGHIKVIPSHMDKALLGLTAEQFSQLSDSVDVIVHNAALTSVMRDYQSLKAANLESTKTLIELASKNSIPFHQISTIAVGPSPQVPESFVDFHEGLQDGYQQSKWASEKVLQKASLQGLPVSIYRLARMVGSTQDGAVNPKDLVWQIIKSSIRLGALPQLSIKEPWTPVDKISQFVSHQVFKNDLLDSQAKKGLAVPVFNLTPQSWVSLDEVFTCVNDYFALFLNKTLRNATAEQWMKMLSLSGNAEDATLSGFFQKQKISDLKIEYNNEHSLQAVEQADVDLPVFDQELIFRYLNYAVKNGVIETK